MLHGVRMTSLQAHQYLQRLLTDFPFLHLGSAIFAEVVAGSDIPVDVEVVLEGAGAED